MARDSGDMMLKDGKFIRELPPVIGGSYFKTENREYSEEELEWQETLLAAKEREEEAWFGLPETIIGVMLSLIVSVFFAILLIGVFTDA
jgi:hypothetical protein